MYRELNAVTHLIIYLTSAIKMSEELQEERSTKKLQLDILSTTGTLKITNQIINDNVN